MTNIREFADSLSHGAQLSRSIYTQLPGSPLRQFSLTLISALMHRFYGVHRSIYFLTMERHNPDTPVIYGMCH
jgi:hypothetical protein